MYEYKFTLNKVIDGDTIDATIDLGFGIFLKERIRLLGIDAPETRLQSSIQDPEKRIKEKELGILAKNELTKLLEGENKTLIIKTKLDKQGKYGRILGEILINENECLINANDFLLSNGYVRKYI